MGAQKVARPRQHGTRAALLAAASAIICLLIQTAGVRSQSGDDYDYFVLAVQYGPTFCESTNCSIEPVDQFTIHGLWASDYQGDHPEFCDNSDDFSTRNLESSTLDQMNCEWESLTSSNEGFWSYEWAKHGTCSKSELPTQEAYFSKALELADEYDVNVALSDIMSNEMTTASLSDIEDALEESFKVKAAPRCDSGNLKEVHICIDKNTFEAIDCPDSKFNSCPSTVTLPQGESVDAQCSKYFPDGSSSPNGGCRRPGSWSGLALPVVGAIGGILMV